MICTLCSSPLTNRIDKFYYDCGTCHAIVKDSQYYLSAIKEKARYEEHNNDVNDIGYQNFTSPITNYVLDAFLPEHKGLDYGSGIGPVISKILLDNNYNIVQYDPFFAPNENLLNDKYDYIVSCEVFEHFHNPKKEIEKLSLLLKQNGCILIMTSLFNSNIDFNNWYYRNDPTHIFIFRKETFEYIALEMKFQIEFMNDKFIVLKKLDND